jgi:enoyl-CoA hydratase/carnithine racemase
MTLVQVEPVDDVAVLKLNRGTTNAINIELAVELSNAVEQVRRSKYFRALVLTSSNDKFFSIGFDVPELINLSRREFLEFYHAFNQLCLNLYTLPKPTIAAITGHAIAGGCILTLCCDYRYISQGRKLIGLNEIKLGLPIPYFADRTLRQIVGDRAATEILYTGEFYLPEKALEMKLVDGVFPADEVLQRSIEKVGEIGKLPNKAFAVLKENRTREISNEFLRNFEEELVTFVDFWFSDEAQERLREAIKNF